MSKRCYLRGTSALDLFNTIIGCLFNRVLVVKKDNDTGEWLGYFWAWADRFPRRKEFMSKNLITVNGVTYVCYKHYNNEPWVRQDLKGKHWEYCLCHACVEFAPDDTEANCPIAQELFELDRQNGLVTPVWECPEFLPREKVEA